MTDRVSYKAEWLGKSFTLVDTGGWESDALCGIDVLRLLEHIAVEQADVVSYGGCPRGCDRFGRALSVCYAA